MNQLSFEIPLQAYDGGTLVDWWKSEGPPLLKALSLNGTFVYDAVLDSLTGFVGKIHHTIRNIRESVDSLCRDGADMPIVRVHRKAFLICERSRSKPFWAPSYSIPVVLYPTIPLK